MRLKADSSPDIFSGEICDYDIETEFDLWFDSFDPWDLTIIEKQEDFE